MLLGNYRKLCVHSLHGFEGTADEMDYSEEEDPDEYSFPLTLRSKRPHGPTSPAEAVTINGDS